MPNHQTIPSIPPRYLAILLHSFISRIYQLPLSTEKSILYGYFSTDSHARRSTRPPQAVTRYFCDPVEWAKTVAKAGAPWYTGWDPTAPMDQPEEGVVGLSGLCTC
jgi:hypothetical protein